MSALVFVGAFVVFFAAVVYALLYAFGEDQDRQQEARA